MNHPDPDPTYRAYNAPTLVNIGRCPNWGRWLKSSLSAVAFRGCVCLLNLPKCLWNDVTVQGSLFLPSSLKRYIKHDPPLDPLLVVFLSILQWWVCNTSWEEVIDSQSVSSSVFVYLSFPAYFKVASGVRQRKMRAFDFACDRSFLNLFNRMCWAKSKFD